MYKVLFSSPFLEYSGYSVVGRSYIKAMMDDKDNFDIKLDSVTYSLDDSSKYTNKGEFDEFFPFIVKSKQDSRLYDRVFINHITPNIAYSIKNYKNNILYSIWETDRIPKGAELNCNLFDIIFTASEFSKYAFLNGGVTVPIEIIPHIVEPRDLKENSFLEEKTKDKFVFLSIFEWHKGKGYDTLIKGYLDAFENNSDVLLILKVNSFTNLYNLKEEVISYIKSIKKDLKYPQILPIIGPIKTDDLYSLYRYSNCYVSCSRREGFSLTAADGIVNGKIVIAADKGGHREFLNHDNSVLIPSDFVDIEDVEKERAVYKGQRWVEMNYDIFVESLKAVENEWKTPDKEQLDYFEVEKQKVIKQLSRQVIIDKFLYYFDKYNINKS